MNVLKFSFRTPLDEPIFFSSILIDHNRTAHGLKSIEMDHLRSGPIMENHVNFCMLHHDQNSFALEIVKQNVCEPSSSSLAFENHKPIALEEEDDEIIEFDDEFDSESEIELETDPVAQKLLNAYLFWSDKEKKIKEIEVKKTINIKS